MANDDQRRDAAGNDHAMGIKPESRVRDDRAKELAKREERRKTEQMKADTQKKAESTKAEERRTAEGRRQEERKRAERRQESPAIRPVRLRNTTGNSTQAVVSKEDWTMTAPDSGRRRFDAARPVDLSPAIKGGPKSREGTVTLMGREEGSARRN